MVTEPNSCLAERGAHLQQLVELCVLMMVVNLACYWVHCEQKWCAQRMNWIFKSLKAEHNPFHRSSENSLAHCFSLRAVEHCIVASSGQAAKQLLLGSRHSAGMHSRHQQSPAGSSSPGHQHDISHAPTKPHSLGSGLQITGEGKIRAAGAGTACALSSSAASPCPLGNGKENAQGHSKIKILSWKSPGQLNPRPSC